MAGKLTVEASKDSAEMNMTPMIDCVFQLIIFFMVVAEIKKADDADVQLPRTRLTSGPGIEHSRVVVNCTWGVTSGPAGAQITDRLIVRNRSFDGPSLQQYLEQLDRADRAKAGRPAPGTAGPDTLSRLFVRIRADARCEWRTVQTAQLACQQAGVWQVSYGTQPVTRQQ